ncbi:hypothetical protein [Spirosoma pollinicola]|uniref:hypothetical protein n=1 Tax=Spirosoma pollinicola TaxID=2057025 RepID=UPI0012FE22FE|nr:hypothetical protein [Spirosoma pollinicola]
MTRTYDWLLVSLLGLAYTLIDALEPEQIGSEKQDPDWLMGYSGNSSKSYILP